MPLVFGVVALAVLFAPLWPEFIDGRFALEPIRRALVHTEVPGTVTEILSEEGQTVAAGAPLLRLRNLELESAAAQAGADLRSASARAMQAGMSYENFGPAEHERQQSTERHRSLAEEMKLLEVSSPIAGTVTTPRIHDLLGTYLKPGTEVAEVADLSTMTARIYVPEFSMRDVRLGARCAFMPSHNSSPGPGPWRRWLPPPPRSNQD